MSDAPTLIGYGPSVYCRMVRLVLAELSVPLVWEEMDPFDAPGTDPHPMNRVPVLRQGDFALWETGAITRYLDRLHGATLTPDEPRAAARMDQVIGIVDAYAYWPLVRQVYSHAVFDPSPDGAADVSAGLAAAEPVLDMLEEIAVEGLVLTERRTLADCHLAPILAAFAAAEAGQAALDRRHGLARWVAALDGWPAFRDAGAAHVPPGAAP